MSLEALESLIESPGWRVFRAHVEQEWGPTGQRYQAELDKALDALDDHASASQARQVRSGQKVILALLRWPEEELARLTRQAQQPEITMSRRGTL